MICVFPCKCIDRSHRTRIVFKWLTKRVHNVCAHLFLLDPPHMLAEQTHKRILNQHLFNVKMDASDLNKHGQCVVVNAGTNFPVVLF